MERDLAEAGRTNLLNAVAILASPLEAQLAWLERIGTLPLIDELALEFDDGYMLLDQLLADGLITSAGARAAADVDEALDAIQASDFDWDTSSLEKSPEWSEVRRTAGLALVELLPAPARA